MAQVDNEVPCMNGCTSQKYYNIFIDGCNGWIYESNLQMKIENHKSKIL